MGVLLELDGSSKMGVVGEAEKFAWKNRDGLEETEYKEGKWHVGMNVCTCVIRQARDQSAEQEMAITEQRGVCVCVVWKRTVVIDCRLIVVGLDHETHIFIRNLVWSMLTTQKVTCGVAES